MVADDRIFNSGWGEYEPEQEMPIRGKGKHKFVLAGEIVPNIAEPGLVDGVLETEAFTVVYGPSGCGKTAVVVGLAGSIAAGQPWRGHQTKSGLVLYFAAENAESTRRRVRAWIDHHGYPSPPLAVIHTPLQLDAAEVKHIMDVIKEAEDAVGQQAVLTVLDTLARTMPGDEDKNKDMNAYVAAADAIKSNTAGHVLCIHHTGKNEARGARGASALKAATDHEWEVFRNGTEGGIVLSKTREGDLEGRVYGFHLQKVELGVNRLGREVSTIVALGTDKAPARKKKKASGDTKGAADLELVRAQLDGPMAYETLKAKVGALRDDPSTNRGAWSAVKKKLAIDDSGIVQGVAP